MKQYDDSGGMVDSIAPFGSKKLPSVKHKRKSVVTSRAETGLPTSSQQQRLETNGLRPTNARAGVLSTLEKAAPSCLDASQIYLLLSTQFDSLAQGSVYRALNDLWAAGLLVRTAGARGRAFYAIKPETPEHQYVTLRCHCGARLVFIEDLAFRKRLQLLVFQEGFVPDTEPVFIITTTCSKCRKLRKGA
ncbi:Fur family transcriptional regulator [Herbaspirillum rubrisubalbicans]|uniref:Ferric uptake regulator family protein n=1 Tax=Herbaspirillum rubrisubalbicans TaxID=80842 RepID=A0AAD0UAR7_9BURK|nr:transcriptional repressor [Herbaspirillum rubrisubalbicans]AYR26518.1 ferric uptake regulator family protein [Herbaspirillum rubrisubalbicans]